MVILGAFLEVEGCYEPAMGVLPGVVTFIVVNAVTVGGDGAQHGAVLYIGHLYVA